MPDTTQAHSIADLPAQKAAAPASAAEGRARYFNTGNAFNVQLPPVPDHAFADEPARALDPATPTGLIPCDISGVLGCDFPATSPFVLARYARIRAGEELAVNFIASGVVHYVIAGSGITVSGDETVNWQAGDVFVTPGDSGQTHRAGDSDAVLWIVTNEPQLAFERSQNPLPGAAPTGVVHYPAAEIDRQIALIYQVGRGEEIAGSALIFSSDMQEASRNVLPTLTVAMNSLPAGVVQRPHRHNSVAVSLVIRGKGCFSMIDGRRKDWSPWATTITPPVSVHSHHNAGDEQALFLIIQDGGLFYHARAMGFEFVDA
ncbi:MAG: cupin domain-containing protein [Proteobacteria bacterium]|nr:cupin domain-containing protein [Pseudomonadota bacterium]